MVREFRGNKYKLTQPEFYVFDVYDIDQQKYLLPEDRQLLCQALELNHVPVVVMNADPSSATMQQLIDSADGTSVLADVKREGLVYKSITEHDVSFKVISNQWLLKNE